MLRLLMLAGVLLLAAGPLQAQEILGLRLGEHKLQDVLSRLGLTPLAPPGEELCYAAENPLESTWVVFGTDERGRWEVLTRVRVLSSAPPGMICSRTPLITSALRQGRKELELKLEDNK